MADPRWRLLLGLVLTLKYFLLKLDIQGFLGSDQKSKVMFLVFSNLKCQLQDGGSKMAAHSWDSSVFKIFLCRARHLRIGWKLKHRPEIRF